MTTWQFWTLIGVLVAILIVLVMARFVLVRLEALLNRELLGDPLGVTSQHQLRRIREAIESVHGQLDQMSAEISVAVKGTLDAIQYATEDIGTELKRAHRKPFDDSMQDFL